MKLLEKIIVPVNFEHTGQPQIDLAADIAVRFNSRLVLVQILPPEAELKELASMISRFIETEFEKVGKVLEKKGVNFMTLIRYGDLFDQIISVAEDQNANLILIEDGFKRESKSITIDIIIEKLIRKSEKPIWVIRQDKRVLPEKILCPVDFSDASGRALSNAVKIARIFNAELHVLNVFEPMPESFSLRLNIDYKDENSRLEEDNRKNFDNFLKGIIFTDVKYRTTILEGIAYRKIIEYAKSEDIDLIFMGATGKSLFQRIFLGSVTEMVVRDLPCSIVITKSEKLLQLIIDAHISDIEEHFDRAQKLEKAGFYPEAIEQLNICLQINDLHLPAMNALVKLYEKTGEKEMADFYNVKVNQILRRLWDKKVEMEIRRNYRIK